MSDARGCGFISPVKRGNDLPFSLSDVVAAAEPLAVGARVEYEHRRDARGGRHATRIALAA